MPPHNGRAFFMAIISHTQYDLQVHHVFFQHLLQRIKAWRLTSKGASKCSDGLILFSIVFSLSGDIAHSPACFNFDSILSSLQRTKTKNKTFEGQIIKIFKEKKVRYI